MNLKGNLAKVFSLDWRPEFGTGKNKHYIKPVKIPDVISAAISVTVDLEE